MVAFSARRGPLVGMLVFLACLNHAKRAVSIDISMLGGSNTFAVATNFGWFFAKKIVDCFSPLSMLAIIFTFLTCCNS